MKFVFNEKFVLNTNVPIQLTFHNSFEGFLQRVHRLKQLKI